MRSDTVYRVVRATIVVVPYAVAVIPRISFKVWNTRVFFLYASANICFSPIFRRMKK